MGELGGAVVIFLMAGRLPLTRKGASYRCHRCVCKLALCTIGSLFELLPMEYLTFEKEHISQAADLLVRQSAAFRESCPLLPRK
jgi:hypothetical protein